MPSHWRDRDERCYQLLRRRLVARGWSPDHAAEAAAREINLRIRDEVRAAGSATRVRSARVGARSASKIPRDLSGAAAADRAPRLEATAASRRAAPVTATVTTITETQGASPCDARTRVPR